MSIYRVIYTEFEFDITNYNFFYKNTKHAKILAIFCINQKYIKIFCDMYKLYNQVFVNLGNLGISEILDFYIYIYYTCEHLGSS